MAPRRIRDRGDVRVCAWRERIGASGGWLSRGLRARREPADDAEMYLWPVRPIERRGAAAFYPGQVLAAEGYFAEVEAGLARVGDRPTTVLSSSWSNRSPAVSCSHSILRR